MLEEIGQFLLTAASTAVLLRFAGFSFKREKKGPPKPVCGCEHDFAMHDLRSGECHALIQGEAKTFYRSGGVESWHKIQCGCRHYTGPIPVELEFRPPPIMPRDETSG